MKALQIHHWSIKRWSRYDLPSATSGRWPRNRRQSKWHWPPPGGYWALFIFCTVMLAGCSKMPVRDYMLPTATVDPAAAVARLNSPAFQIPYLGSSAAMWHASALLERQESSAPFSSAMLDSANRLGLTLSAELLERAKSDDEKAWLINGLADQIEEQYGQRSRSRFDIEYHTTAAGALLGDGQTASGVPSSLLLHEAGLHMLDALGAATHLGLDQTIIQAGQEIMLPLLSRVAIEEGSGQIEAWTEAVDYAYRGEPTPMPPPSPEEQAGKDVTVSLPPGNRWRGEILHEETGCSACHISESIGPQWRAADGTGYIDLLTVATQRLQDPNYQGNATNAIEYLIESTVLPDIYVADGYEIALMSFDYGTHLSKQDLADLIAFLTAIGP